MPKSSEGIPVVLAINGGSSSIKFALFSASDLPTRHLHGELERIGHSNSQLTAQIDKTSPPDIRPMKSDTFLQAANNLTHYIQEQLGDSALIAIGHRVVHGGPNLTHHQLITPKLLAELRHIQPLDPTHLPQEIALIKAFQKAFPKLPQMACFDTAFHHAMPTVAKMLPIPRRYYNHGIRKFGFHGLSYTYLMNRLHEIAGPKIAGGRIILAHLGSGSSMAAVHKSKPIDTTMAFTPLAGLMMATRPGDLDPGLLTYLMRKEKLTPNQLDNLLSHHCGLLGISETSGDMRDLLAKTPTDPRATEAVALFCYQAKKYIGALTASLGGLDTLIFTGGIGEHSPQTRAAICEGLQFLHLKLNSRANQTSRDVISTPQSKVTVRIIPTDEEIIIAQSTLSLLNG